MFFKKKKPEFKATVITDDNFQELVLENDKGVLIDFWAPWCGPCKVLGPLIDELAKEFDGRALICKVNVDSNPKLSSYFKVKSIPTLVFIKDQTMIEKMSGMVPKPNLRDMIEDLIEYKVEKSDHRKPL